MREYKVVVLGCGGVGKSSLTIQFVQGIFVKDYCQTIEDHYRKTIELKDTIVMLEVLDMPSTVERSAMRDLYLKNGQGFLLVYSVTSKQSFEDLLSIRNEIIQIKGTNRVPMVLVGNKADLEHERLQVPTSEGMILANRWGVPFYESSAKSTQNVNDIFIRCALEVMANREQSSKKCCCGCVLL